MADNFGLKIGIEGEREFKNALREINQDFKVLGSEMNLVTSQFDKQDKSLQAVTARNEVLNKEIDAQKEKVTTLEAALKNAAESFGENDKRTKAWQVQLNNANADLNKMEKELEELKQFPMIEVGGIWWGKNQIKELIRIKSHDDTVHAQTLRALEKLEAENKKLREAMQFAVDHLSSMDDYSIVNGAIYRLREALSSGGE